jgi:uncharacterized OB-fold protein
MTAARPTPVDGDTARPTAVHGDTTAARRTPVADGLFTEVDGDVRLLGSQCEACGVITFPRQASCPRCTSLDVRDRPLGRRGTLWSWTIQCFAPKSPPYAVAAGDAFEPYGVGYVELPGEVRVEARLTESDPARLRIGMPMELSLIPAPGREADGVVTYAFEPVDERCEPSTM